jgi:AcrR family transcriptional regulator
MRAIAAEAGVDPSLIHHYFGTKDQLFAVSIDIPDRAAQAVRALKIEDPGQLGRRLAATFFMVWEEEEPRSSLLGILRSAMGGEDLAIRAFRQFLTSLLVDGVAPKLEGEKSRLRAQLMGSHLVGVAIARYVVKLEPLASTPVEDVVDLLAPRVQSYVDHAVP